MTIQFVSPDAQVIEQQLIRDFEQKLGVVLYPGDERRMFLEQLVQVIVGLKGDINQTGQANLWRYASGSVLDALAEMIGVTRLPAQSATVMLRFTLSETRQTPVVIPAGTRATPDGKLYFATTKQLTIAAGQTTGSVLAQSTATGEPYNGFSVGQISSLVDPIAYVASVTNTDISSGGADIENDDSLRARGRLAPAAFSTAGPERAYVYWATSADSTISDVAVTSATPGVVSIYVLLDEGVIPGQSVLDKVNAAVNDRYRRPLTDQVQVLAPTAVPYDVTLTYYISTERVTEEATIKTAVEAAVTEHAEWQRAKLGRAVNPDHLRQLIMNAGASRITLTAPTYAAVAISSVATLGTSAITYGGLE